jgi:Mg2+-importing ATPase
MTVGTIAIALPHIPLRHSLGFTPLPLALLATIALLTVTYLALVQVVKTWFYRRHALL